MIYRFQISIPASEYIRYYQGSAQAVIVHSEDGRRIRLPANYFRSFVEPSGIYGRFEITLDKDNRLIDIHRI